MARRPDDRRLRAWRALLGVHAAAVEALEAEMLNAQELPLAWYDLLIHLRLAGGALRMHELAERVLISRSGATRFVDRLEEAGLVERRICPEDRRGMEVVLTPKGRRVQERAAPVALRGIQQHFGRHLTDEQAEALAEALEVVLKAETATKAVSPAD
jgi:DNA-binding MarR family transcriptional regulator